MSRTRRPANGRVSEEGEAAVASLRRAAGRAPAWKPLRIGNVLELLERAFRGVEGGMAMDWEGEKKKEGRGVLGSTGGFRFWRQRGDNEIRDCRGRVGDSVNAEKVGSLSLDRRYSTEQIHRSHGENKCREAG